MGFVVLLGMQQARAWNPLDLRKLKETKECIQGGASRCDLRGADLRWANLEEAKLARTTPLARA